MLDLVLKLNKGCDKDLSSQCVAIFGANHLHTMLVHDCSSGIIQEGEGEAKNKEERTR